MCATILAFMPCTCLHHRAIFQLAQRLTLLKPFSAFLQCKPNQTQRFDSYNDFPSLKAKELNSYELNLLEYLPFFPEMILIIMNSKELSFD